MGVGNVPQRGLPLWRRLLPRHPVRRGAVLVVLALVVEYLILPQVAGINQALHLLGRVNLSFVALGILLEAASLASYARLTRAVLPRGISTFSRIWRIDMATLAISHVLPGGAAGGGGLGFKLLTAEGASGSDAGFALATQGLGSALVLNFILWVALVISIPLTGFNPLYATAAAVGGVVIAVFAAAVLALTKGEERAASMLGRAAARLPFLKEDVVDRVVHDLAKRIRTMSADRSLLVRAVGWAAANWLLDAAALFVFLAAFGHVENPDGLLVAYGLANVLAAIPITPGGLGIVEAVLVPALVGFGSARGVAVLGVIGYRLVNFWLPIPVGAGCYLWLRSDGEGGRIKRADALRKMVEEAASARTDGSRERKTGPEAS